MRQNMCLALAALAVLCLGVADASKDPTLFKSFSATQILRARVLGYTTNGVFAPLGTPCLNPALNNPCIHKVNQGEDNSVQITWSPTTNTTVLTADKLASLTAQKATVMLRGCFTNVSNFDAGWRKPKDLLRKDGQCKTKIATGLPLTGNFSWVMGENVPTATMFIRAYVMVPTNQTYGPTPVGYGQSNVNSGFFQTQQVNHRPPALIAAASCCACVGPLLLVSYFAFEKFMKKSK